MAPTTPDPATFTSSADVFSGDYTLPQIKSLPKALHVQIEEKSSRLRTQVGNSYRELLGTADTIVHMRDDNERVQDLLGRMGGRCGRGVIGSKVAGLANFATREESSAANETARLRLLEACSLTAGRILQGGGGGGVADAQMGQGERLVMATKMLVIGRLLVKSLRGETTSQGGLQAANAAGKTLDSLRKRVQRSIERLLEKVDESADTDDAVKALCAHSLANSSGAKHAISHLIRVRQRAMETALDVEQEERTTTTEDVVHGLRLYTKTRLDVQALVPLKLSQALSRLKSQRLLADPSLSKIEGLRLDMHGRWCSEEMQDFTPFVRHDDLDGEQARDMLGGFAENGRRVILSGLKKTLNHMVDFKSITDLRTQVLQLWIRDGGRARGFDPQEMQDDLREAINARLMAVVEAKATKLRLVGSEIKATLEGWQDGVSDKSQGLWDDDGYDAALSAGAVPFLQEVVSRLHGRNDAVSRASHSYASWFRIIGDVKAVVEQLGKQRWDNDHDEIEDEETIEARQKDLSREDPKRLQEKLDETVDASFAALETQIRELWRQHGEGAASGGGAMAIYLVRVVRDIRAQLPDRAAVEKFGLSMVPGWHARVAAMACRSAVGDFIRAGPADRSVAMRPLWDGEPPLPSQPSPGVFHLLRDLSLNMTGLGVDLWTPAAVGELKRQVGGELCAAWRRELESLLAGGPETNGEPDDGPGGEAEAAGDGGEPENKPEGGAEAGEGDEEDGKPGGKAEAAGEGDEEDRKPGGKAEAAGEGDEEGDEPKDGNEAASEGDEEHVRQEKEKGEEEEEEGEEAEEEAEEPAQEAGQGAVDHAHDTCTQWLFDVALLRCCVGNSPGETADEYAALAESLAQQSGLDEAARRKVAKTAGDFWGRIKLLFGLLA